MRKNRQDSNSSMSSQRLEEILTALMKPPKDIQENFEMNISSLLDDFMIETEQLHEADNLHGLNFSEMALVLQQSAIVYGKKVDYLCSQVLDFLNSFGTVNRNRDDDDEPQVQTTDQQRPRTRKKQEVQLVDFIPIALEEATNISIKKNVEVKQLATLPKNFIQFEPRIISDNDVHIMDYNGQLVGVMSDFRVNWNTDENGMLVDDLDISTDTQTVVEQLYEVTSEENMSTSVAEHAFDDSAEDFDNETLNELIEEPPSLQPSPADILAAAEASMAIANTPDVTLIDTPVEICNQKKRKIIDENTPVRRKSSKYDLSESLVTPDKLKSVDCYFESPNWVQKMIERRKNKLRKLKRRLDDTDIGERMLDTEYLLDAFVSELQCVSGMAWYRQKILKGIKILETPWKQDFAGFPKTTDQSPHSEVDPNGFIGFKTAAIDTPEEFSSLSILYQSFLAELPFRKPTSFPAITSDDEDDHHADDENLCCPIDQSVEFESRAETLQPVNNPASCLPDESDVTKRVEAWHTSIQEKLVRAEQRQNFDIWSYSSKVLNTFQKSGSSVISFRDVIRKKPQDDVARYLLATLMLANSSNVAVDKVSTEGCGNFQMRLLSMEKRHIEEDFPF